jgi:hypothetical protein
MTSATVSDDDVGDKVQLVDQADLQLQVETLVSFNATQIFNVDLEQPFHSFSANEKDDALVLETSEYIEILIDPGRNYNASNNLYNSKRFNLIAGALGILPDRYI